MTDNSLPDKSRRFARGAHGIEARQNVARHPVYVPSQETIKQSQMTQFARGLQNITGRTFSTYNSLACFCCNEFRVFWEQFLYWSKPNMRERSVRFALGTR